MVLNYLFCSIIEMHMVGEWFQSGDSKINPTDPFAESGAPESFSENPRWGAHHSKREGLEWRYDFI